MLNDTTGPKGLGGWLILPALGLFLTPFLIGTRLFSDFLPLFTDGTWTALTNPGSEYYLPGWGALLLFEIMGNVFVILLDLVLVGLFFMESPRFPILFICFLAFNALFTVVDLAWARAIIPLDAQMGLDGLREVTRAVGAAVVWIPYIVKSRRVKNTFAHKRPVFVYGTAGASESDPSGKPQVPLTSLPQVPDPNQPGVPDQDQRVIEQYRAGQ